VLLDVVRYSRDLIAVGNRNRFPSDSLNGTVLVRQLHAACCFKSGGKRFFAWSRICCLLQRKKIR